MYAAKIPRGFTLIELLIVIGILAVLVVVASASLIHSYAEAHRLRRITDFRAIQHALSLYAADNNGAYPLSTGNGAYWNSQCTLSTGYPGGNLAPDSVIPGLSPTYLPAMPADPAMAPTTVANGMKGICCYIYKSDGKNYKMIDFNCAAANYADPTFKRMGMIDPCRPGTNMPSFAIGVWTPGAATCAVSSPPNGW